MLQNFDSFRDWFVSAANLRLHVSILLPLDSDFREFCCIFLSHITIHFSVRLCFVCCLNSKDASNYCLSDDCSICWLFSTNFLHPFTLFPVSWSLLNGTIQAFTWHTGYSILFVLHSLRLFANIASRSVSNNHWILLISGPKISHRSESLYHVSNTCSIFLSSAEQGSFFESFC